MKMSTPMHTRRQNFQAFSRYVGLGVPHYLMLIIPNFLLFHVVFSVTFIVYLFEYLSSFLLSL